MATKKYRQKRIEFEEFLIKRGLRKLYPTKALVEFYCFIKNFHEVQGWVPSRERIARTAKRILEWSEADLEKAIGLIYDFALHYEENNLEWTIETVYRKIPEYVDGRIYHSHDTLSQEELLDLQIEETKKRIEKLS